MRRIIKAASPVAFEDWKSTNKPTTWEALQNDPPYPEEGVIYYSKRNLREALLIEQGFICCYCQCRIENTEHTVIEHWYPRNGADKLQGAAKTFDHDNLMAACDGGESENKTQAAAEMKPYPVWCDKSKGRRTIALSPLQPDIESRFQYTQVSIDEVRISPITNLDLEAGETLGFLNLNTPFLEKRRGEAIAGLIIEDTETNTLISAADAAVLLANLEAQVQAVPIERLSPFYTVKVHFLRLISGK